MGTIDDNDEVAPNTLGQWLARATALLTARGGSWQITPGVVVVAVRLRSYVSSFCWMLLIAVAGTAVCLLALVAPSGRFLMPVARIWARGVLRASGIRVDYDGADQVLDQTPRIFMANHQSFLDMVVILPMLPDNTRFLATHIQKWIPFFGWSLMASRGCIFIGTGNLERARRSIEQATERIRGGHCLLVFPEGKRTRDRQMLPFKKGVFHLAIAAGVPIIPIAITGVRDLMPPGSLAIRRGNVQVRFGDPIVPPYHKTAEELSIHTRSTVAELLAGSQSSSPLGRTGTSG